MNKAQFTTGKVTAERVVCGYGERIVIAIDRNLPNFVNNGFNAWFDREFKRLALDRIPPADHPSNDCNADQIARGQFMGWVKGRFANGETWLFISLAHEAYDSKRHEYTQPIFAVQG